MARRLGTVLLVVVAVALLVIAPTPAVAGTGIRAVLDGMPISLEQAGQLSCHDFDFPVLTCFTSAEQMEAAAAARATGLISGASPGSNAARATGYVVVFEDGAYRGAALAISQDYSYLGTIGWNDRISSLKSYGATGHFWDNAPMGGFVYYFYSTTQVSYVGDYYNDKFSAVYLT